MKATPLLVLSLSIITATLVVADGKGAQLDDNVANAQPGGAGPLGTSKTPGKSSPFFSQLKAIKAIEDEITDEARREAMSPFGNLSTFEKAVQKCKIRKLARQIDTIKEAIDSKIDEEVRRLEEEQMRCQAQMDKLIEKGSGEVDIKALDAKINELSKKIETWNSYVPQYGLPPMLLFKKEKKKADAGEATAAKQR